MFCSTFGTLYSAHFRIVTGVFTEERQLESFWTRIIRVILFRHPVPLVVMVICQQETEYLVHILTAVFILAVIPSPDLIRQRHPVIKNQIVIVTEGLDVSTERYG